MFATAGNTTDAASSAQLSTIALLTVARNTRPSPSGIGDELLNRYSAPVRVLGGVASAAGLWMVVAPQARLGLPALRWMSESAFQGEAILGAVVLLTGLWMSLGGRESVRTIREPSLRS